MSLNVTPITVAEVEDFPTYLSEFFEELVRG